MKVLPDWRERGRLFICICSASLSGCNLDWVMSMRCQFFILVFGLDVACALMLVKKIWSCSEIIMTSIQEVKGALWSFLLNKQTLWHQSVLLTERFVCVSLSSGKHVECISFLTKHFIFEVLEILVYVHILQHDCHLWIPRHFNKLEFIATKFEKQVHTSPPSNPAKSNSTSRDICLNAVTQGPWNHYARCRYGLRCRLQNIF